MNITSIDVLFELPEAADFWFLILASCLSNERDFSKEKSFEIVSLSGIEVGEVIFVGN